MKGTIGDGDLDSVSPRGEGSFSGLSGDNRGFGAVGRAGGEPRGTEGRFGTGGGVSLPSSAGILAGESSRFG